jgi:LmbE family N-acetylglucosaminyl deacetylase
MIAFSGFKQVKRLLCLGAYSDDMEIGVGEPFYVSFGKTRA